jgi:2-keto-3-deoxy-6-phosphogluconate aldolase
MRIIIVLTNTSQQAESLRALRRVLGDASVGLGAPLVTKDLARATRAAAIYICPASRARHTPTRELDWLY